MFFIAMIVLSAVFATGQDPWEELSTRAKQHQEADDFAGAESSRREALRIAEETLGPEDPRLAPLYADLALTLHFEARDADADPLAHRASAIATHSGDQRLMGVMLNVLGIVLTGEHLYDRAEPVLRRSVALLEQSEGPASIDVAKAANSLALVYLDDRQYAKAQQEEARALPIYDRLGPDSPDVALVSGNMFTILAAQHRDAEGEPYLRRALAIGEKVFPYSLKMANLRICLAALESSRENYKEAARLLESAIATQERVLGPTHPELAHTLAGYSNVLRHMHEKTEAKIVQNRANSILKASLNDVK